MLDVAYFGLNGFALLFCLGVPEIDLVMQRLHAAQQLAHLLVQRVHRKRCS